MALALLTAIAASMVIATTPPRMIRKTMRRLKAEKRSIEKLLMFMLLRESGFAERIHGNDLSADRGRVEATGPNSIPRSRRLHLYGRRPRTPHGR
ncbi:MAG: hypothetical protein WAO61_02235 [Solirubrobacterales bacterium]